MVPQAITLGLDFARALDPCLLARDVGITPDAIQAQLLTTTSRKTLVLCCRQWGKSTTTAIVALHEAVYVPNSMIVVISPSQPQSTELFKKIHGFWQLLPGAPAAEQESLTRMQLANGSRIISLPGSEKTVRGYSAANLTNIDYQPPWMVAGVDYHVGCPENISLTPITSSQPVGTSLSGSVLTVNANNVTINGYDFSVAAGSTLGVFTGSISGTTLTVSGVTSGLVYPGGIITSGAAAGTRIVEQLTSTAGTSGGNPIANGTGTYEVSISQNVSSTSMTETAAGVSISCTHNNLTVTNNVFGGSNYSYGGGNFTALLMSGVGLTVMNCNLDLGVTLFQQNSSGPYSTSNAFISTSGDTQTVTVEYNWFKNSACQYLDIGGCSVSLSYKYNLLDQCWPGVTAGTTFHQNTMQWGGSVGTNVTYSFNTQYQSSPAGGEGPQFGGALDQTMTMENPVCTYNTILCPTGPTGDGMSYVVMGREVNCTISNGTIGYNYHDPTGSFALYYPGTCNAAQGWTNQLGNSFDVVTGALENPT